MKSLSFAIICLSLISASAAGRATVLPDACGSDKTKFDVKTQKNAPPISAPAEGKALLVFIESIDKGSLAFCIGCKATVRVGLDGAWAGANQGDSYFTVAVAPGEHHLCANWQSSQRRLAKNVGMATLNAEAGQVYYFETRIAEQPGEVSGTGGNVSQGSDWAFTLKQLSDDEGKYKIKLSALAKANAM